MPTHEQVGSRIRDARKGASMTQAQLGAALIPPRTHAAISDIERGKTHVDVESMTQLASRLDVPLSALYEAAVQPGRYGGGTLVVSLCMRCGRDLRDLFDTWMEGGTHGQ